jgi:hypothetical protein
MCVALRLFGCCEWAAGVGASISDVLCPTPVSRRWLYPSRCCPARGPTVVFRGNVRRPLYLSIQAAKTGTVGALKSGIQDLRPGLHNCGPTTPALQVRSSEHVVDSCERRCIRLAQRLPLAVPREGRRPFLCFPFSRGACLLPHHPLLLLPWCRAVQVHADDLYLCRQYRDGGVSEEVPNDTPLSQIKETDQLIVFQLPPLAAFQREAPTEVQVCPSACLVFVPAHGRAGAPIQSSVWWGRVDPARALQVGTLVDARWENRARMYPGIVTASNADGSFAVQYNDGDFCAGVAATDLQPRCPAVLQLPLLQRSAVVAACCACSRWEGGRQGGGSSQGAGERGVWWG